MLRSFKYNGASLPIPTGVDQEAANEPGALRHLKVQQYSLENQIKDLSDKMFVDKSSDPGNEQKQPIHHKIKLLAIKLSLNTAEQKALAGENVENILHPIDTMLIEKNPTFPLDTQWLKEKISYIRRLAH